MLPCRCTDRPSKEYEVVRRRIERDVNEMKNYISSNLKDIIKHHLLIDIKVKLKLILENVQHREQVIIKDLKELKEVDGYKSFRKQEAKELSDLVQARLQSLQNPTDCSKAKRLVCDLNKACGYGCQIHHAVYCFIVAYGSERMLVLNSEGWKYNYAGFESFFLPLSDTCQHPNTSSTVPDKIPSDKIPL